MLSMSRDALPVAVIGAQGFVGRRVVQYLKATQDFRPISAARRRSCNDMSEVEWRQCDATDPDSMAAALRGCLYAVNCVAGDARTMEVATYNLCQEAGAVGLRRIVHLSSMSVYGPATGLIDETQRLDSSAGWYASAKVASEKLMRIDRFRG